MTYPASQLLTSVDAVNKRLDTDNLRIFDCAVYLRPSSNSGYQVDSGRDSFLEAHIPGAAFIDLVEHWSDTTSGLNFTAPPPEVLARSIGETGINDAHDVVLYSSGHLMWATRAWWLLRSAGHPSVQILNGNLNAWRAAGLPLESGDSGYPPTTFEPMAPLTTFASTADVEAGMDGNVCTVNALSPQLYEGTGDFYYKRRGHIPGSYLTFYDTLLADEFFLPEDQLGAALNANGALDADQVITYCGGGIAATLNGFALNLMGQNNVAVYDGSMSEWVMDDSRPLTEGVNP